MVGGTFCWLGVGGGGSLQCMNVIRLSVYECCKMVGGTSCGLGVRGGGRGPFSV